MFKFFLCLFSISFLAIISPWELIITFILSTSIETLILNNYIAVQTDWINLITICDAIFLWPRKTWWSHWKLWCCVLFLEFRLSKLHFSMGKRHCFRFKGILRSKPQTSISISTFTFGLWHNKWNNLLDCTSIVCGYAIESKSLILICTATNQSHINSFRIWFAKQYLHKLSGNTIYKWDDL